MSGLFVYYTVVAEEATKCRSEEVGKIKYFLIVTDSATDSKKFLHRLEVNTGDEPLGTHVAHHAEQPSGLIIREDIGKISWRLYRRHGMSSHVRTPGLYDEEPVVTRQRLPDPGEHRAQDDRAAR